MLASSFGDKFGEEEDDDEIVKDLFKEIDKDGTQHISSSELKDALQKYQSTHEDTDICKALTEMLKTAEDTHMQIGLKEFCNAVRLLPRVRGQRVQWARSLNLHELLARMLKKGNFFDGLHGLKSLKKEELDKHMKQVCEDFSRILPVILEDALDKLRRGDSISAKQQNSKFCMDKAFTGNFAGLDDFYAGPETLIGTPNPNIMEGIKREHCLRSNHSYKYRSPNYNFEFFPAQEYEFVMSPVMHPKNYYPHTPKHRIEWPLDKQTEWKGDEGREPQTLEEVMKHYLVEQVKLKDGEVATLRLYTGPMYMLYNAVMRKFPEDVLERLEGNTYETTIFCIISGISKLSRATTLPRDRRVYRGLGGMLLPQSFWQSDKAGLRGGIEWGLMSTTTNRDVAVNYSGKDKNRGTVFEISVGRIDIGADLSWVSQYPGESEILFPPLTCLEVVGEPRVEGGVIIFPLHANMNLKGLTLEQLEERRKLLHLSMAHNLREELEIDASMGNTKEDEKEDSDDEEPVIPSPGEASLVTDVAPLDGSDPQQATAALSPIVLSQATLQNLSLPVTSSPDGLVSADNQQAAAVSSTSTADSQTILLAQYWKKVLPSSKLPQESAAERLKDWITKVVLDEVDRLTEKHRVVHAKKFNNDRKYKRLTTEAIDAKTMALRKIDFFVEHSTKGMDTSYDVSYSAFLKRIADMPFMEFQYPHTKFQLETGDKGFPWAQVTHGAANIDFKNWRPVTKGLEWDIDEKHFKIMVDSIAKNTHIRVISVEVEENGRTFRLPLQVPDGWTTTHLHWENNRAVENAPGIVNMLLRCCTGLATLNLSSNNIGDEKGVLISPALSVLKNLKDLDMSNNGLGKETAKELSSVLSKLSKLKKLSLSENMFSAQDWSSLAKSVKNSPELEAIFHFGHGPGYRLQWSAGEQRLDYRSQNLEDSEVLVLAELLPRAVSNLQFLDLSDNEFDRDAAETFSGMLGIMTSITHLNLSDNDQAYGHEQWKNRVGQNGYWCERLICAIASLTNLSSLQFHANYVKSEGMKKLSTCLSHLYVLQSLGLSWNEIEDEGCTYLARAVGNLTTLQLLNLQANGISNQGAGEIAEVCSKLTNLRSLNLTNNKIDKDGCEKFNSSLSALTSLTLDLRGNLIPLDMPNNPRFIKI